MIIKLHNCITRNLWYSLLLITLVAFTDCRKKSDLTPTNQAPVANAGADQAITLPTNQVSLTGTGTDADGTISSYAWIKVSGPAGETITTASSANTSVTGLVAGVYVFRLTVTDNNGAVGSDEVQVIVSTASGNMPPAANAGIDQTITLPTNQVSLTGSGTDPDGTITAYAWTKIFGPAGETITSPSTSNTTVTGLVAGVYVFRLTVTDNLGATGNDNVQVTVNSSTPTGIYDLFVASQNTNSVKRYNGITGAFMGDFVSSGSGGLNAPQEVAWGPDGHLYVTGFYTPYLMRYDSANGNYLGQFSSGYALDNPGKMTFGPDGKIYVSQWGATKNKVVRFNATTGAFIDEFTNIAFGPSNAMAHAWDAQGRLYVVGFASKDVKRFDVNGNFIDVFIPTGSGAAQLQGPVELKFDNNNNLFIVDWQASNVKKYNATTGAFISVFISGGLNSCEGITTDNAGNFYITNYYGNAVHKYDPSGNFLGVVASGSGLNVATSVIRGPSQ